MGGFAGALRETSARGTFYSRPMNQQASPESLHPRLRLGTSSWSSRDWESVFYPKGTAPGDYLAFYATRFRTVEVDATFYRIPSLAMTRKWAAALPAGFRLAAKVPQVVTHEKCMIDCGSDLDAFIQAMTPLGEKLGPLLLQFPYHRKASPITESEFLARLERFLPALPSGPRFALEIRNKTWLRAPLLDLLRAHGVALAIIDHPWMPRAAEWIETIDPVTADFAYVRWLGDRHKIEAITTTWDRLVVDRARETGAWVGTLRALLSRGIDVYGYFNNHWGGYAVGSIELLAKSWRNKA